MKLDVIIPCYNEEANLIPLYDELVKTLSKIKYNLIFINDGSKDKTYEILKDIYNKDKNHIKVINFTRNFGKDAAIYAGLKHSKSEYQCIIDSDMQHNPKHLLEMLTFLEDNISYDSVAMVNKYDNENAISKFLKKSFYKIINHFTGLSFKIGASDFRLFRHTVTNALLSLSESNRFTKGLFSWTGFKTFYIEYTPDKRLNGKSSFNLSRQISYANDGITNFSTKPFKLISLFNVINIIITLLAIITLSILKANKLISLELFVILLVVLIYFSIIILILSTIGIYLSKMYTESKNRPIYIENNSLGTTDTIL